MSFYPLVNNEQQLASLDGWLISIIYRSTRLRNKLLKGWNFDRSHQFPFNVPKDEILLRFKKEIIGGKKLMEVPSFLLIYKALAKGLTERGIESVMNPMSNNYDY